MARLRFSRRDSPTPPDAAEAQVSVPIDDPGDVLTAAETDTETDTETDAETDAGPTDAAGDGDRERPGLLCILSRLARTAHPRLGVLTAVVVTLGAVASGREPREILVVALTVLAGQAVLGWHNDLVDRHRDAELHLVSKPLSDGRLEPGTVWFALACAVLLLVPLSVSSGTTAATAYLLCVLAGVLGNVVLRTGALSWVTWAVSAGLLPAFLSYGGWGGQFEGDPPRITITVLAALLGIGVHVLVSLWGLEPDAAAGWRTLPLRLGRRLGSSRLLAATVLWLVGVGVALVAVGAAGGLSR